MGTSRRETDEARRCDPNRTSLCVGFVVMPHIETDLSSLKLILTGSERKHLLGTRPVTDVREAVMALREDEGAAEDA
jgi:hypothetical protein